MAKDDVSEMLDVKFALNLTGHVVNFLNERNQTIRLDPDGECRVTIERDEPIGEIHSIPIYPRKKLDSRYTNLPEPEEGVIIIVSKYVCDAFPERTDLAYPDEQERLGNKILGCRILRLNR